MTEPFLDAFDPDTRPRPRNCREMTKVLEAQIWASNSATRAAVRPLERGAIEHAEEGIVRGKSERGDMLAELH